VTFCHSRQSIEICASHMMQSILGVTVRLGRPRRPVPPMAGCVASYGAVRKRHAWSAMSAVGMERDVGHAMC
jgi:hypothetical protein